MLDNLFKLCYENTDQQLEPDFAHSSRLYKSLAYFEQLVQSLGANDEQDEGFIQGY